jgi:pimeloyl-ACP methyl ester carboxylesterase
MENPKNHLFTSKLWTINGPVNSTTPIRVHTLLYSHAEFTSDPLIPPTVINLHYWGGSALTFHHVATLLQLQQRSKSHDRNASNIISVSFRGWGSSSSAVPDRPHAYSVSVLASDIMNLIQQFQDCGLIPQSGYVLCGHSMGGKVAMAIQKLASTSNPDHLPPLRGILLLAPAPSTPLVLPDDMREQQIHAYETHDSVEWTVRNVLTGSHGEKLFEGQKDLDLIIDNSLNGSTGAKKGWPEVGMAEEIEVSSAKEDDKQIELRVLVSRGDQVETVDRVTKETFDKLKAEGYKIQMRVLEPKGEKGHRDANIGHLLPLEAPEVVAEELERLLCELHNDSSARTL